MLNIMKGKVGKVNLPMKSSLDRWSLSQTVTSRVCPAKSCAMAFSKQQDKKTILRQKEKFMKEMYEGELPNAMLGKKIDRTPKTKKELFSAFYAIFIISFLSIFSQENWKIFFGLAQEPQLMINLPLPFYGVCIFDICGHYQGKKRKCFGQWW